MSSPGSFFAGSPRTGLLIGVGLTVLVLILSALGTFSSLEYMTYDLRFRMRGPEAPGSDIVLVTIDEKSVTQLNRKISQWPRTYYARAIEKLTAGGADLIVLDLDLSKQGLSEPGEDESLAEAVFDSANVILARYITQGKTVSPLPSLRKGEVGEGFINHLPDPDGILRRVPLVNIQIDEEAGEAVPWLSLPLETARLYLHPVDTPVIDLETEDMFVMGKIRTPYPGGRMAVNFTGPPGTFDSISFGDVLTGAFEPGTFSGKIVIVGNTHPAFHDYFPTPFRKVAGTGSAVKSREILVDYSRSMSGVEVLANAVDTVLRERYLTKPPGWARALLVGGLGILASVIFILLNIRARISAMIYLVLSGGIFWAAAWLFSQEGIVLDLVVTEAAMTLPFLGGIAYHRFLTAMEKARITRTFGLYVSHQVVERLIRNPELVKLGGEKKEMTVLFADARAFTSMSEKLDPTDVVRILNQFHTAVTEVIFKHEGVLDKYMGDAVMSFYGAPIEMEDHAARACTSALEMEEALLELHARWQEEGLPIIDMGVGLNTGAMVVGNMGSSMRFDYTVMGDSVNLGSRLEGLNKVYGTRIIVSEFTRQLAGDGFTFRDLDLVRVKGRSEPVRIYELMAIDRQGRPEYLDLYNRAIGLYRLRQWEKAGDLFRQVLVAAPGDGPSILYVERCMEMSRSHPPEDWDGIYEMKVK